MMKKIRKVFLVLFSLFMMLFPFKNVEATTTDTLDFLKEWAIQYDADLEVLESTDFIDEALNFLSSNNYHDFVESMIDRINTVNTEAANRLRVETVNVSTIISSAMSGAVDIDSYIDNNRSAIEAHTNTDVLFSLLNALTSTDTSLQTDLTSMADEMEATNTTLASVLTFIKNYTATYKSSLDCLTNRTVLDNFINKVNAKKYDEAVDVLVTNIALSNSTAANVLSEKRTEIHNAFTSFDSTENNIYNFLNNNKVTLSNTSLLVLDPFIEQLRALYNNCFSNIIDIKNNLYSRLLNSVKQRYSLNKSTTIEEGVSFLTRFKTFLLSHEDYIRTTEARINRWDVLIHDDNLNLLSFGIIADHKIDTYSQKLQTKIDKMVQKIKTPRTTDIDNQAKAIYNNTSLTAKENNDRLTVMINDLTRLKTSFISETNSILNLITLNKTSKMLKNLQTEGINTFDNLITLVKGYFKDDPVLEFFLKSNTMSNIISINESTKYIITKNIYPKNTFISYFNSTYGTINMLNTKNEKSSTGSLLNVTYNNVAIKEFTIIAKGDTLGRGMCDITDVIKVINGIFNESTRVKGIYYTAADMNNDSKVDITDAIMMINNIL